MNTKQIGIFVLVAILVGVGAYFVGHDNGVTFGTTYVNPVSLQNQTLYNKLASVVQDLQAVRSPLAGTLNYSSSTFNIPTLIKGQSSSTISSSTAGASGLAGAAIGDFVLVSVSTTSANIAAQGIGATGNVTAADTITINFTAPTSTAYAGGQFGLDVRILPKASFTAPAALNTATSTSNASSTQ